MALELFGTFAIAALFFAFSALAKPLAKLSLGIFQRYPGIIQRLLAFLTRGSATQQRYYFWQFRILGFIAGAIATSMGLLLIFVR